MRGRIALLVVLLYAVSTYAEPEPEAEADPRVRQVGQPIEVPVAQTDDNKFYVLFGRNGKPETPGEIANLRKDGQLDLSEDDNVEVQSFVPVHDDQYGTLLIPSNALDKVAEDELDEFEDEDGLGKARGRRRGMRRRRRRMRRRNRRQRRRHRRRRHRLRRRRRRHRRRFRRHRRRHRGRRRRRHGRRRRRRRHHRRRHRTRSRRRRRRSRRRRKEAERKRKEEEDYDY